MNVSVTGSSGDPGNVHCVRSLGWPDRFPGGTPESSSSRSENGFLCRPDEEGKQESEEEERRDGGEFGIGEEMHNREDAGPERVEPGTRRREDMGPSRKQRKSPTRQNPRTKEDR
ncbi:hypothetical protein NDU88_000554 [Pleurodeles waltl]|uniref:Uncharacterized protein n=1 Tax=Pleurodeles waltl TaxID=8319 RepID=A0AAV7P172_PLEWA|nr:hypothetical protein NDU88_000554 [Pleurodeles waltl]